MRNVDAHNPIKRKYEAEARPLGHRRLGKPSRHHNTSQGSFLVESIPSGPRWQGIGAKAK